MAERTVVTLGETLAALVEGKKYATLRDILVNHERGGCGGDL